MEPLLERFLRYVAVETTSDEHSETQPSAQRELDLLKMLRDELEQMGIKATLGRKSRPSDSLPMSIQHPTPREKTSIPRSSATGTVRTLC